jgi:quinolinate synthase
MLQLPTVDELPAKLSENEVRVLSDEVRALAAERDAVILAHNYQLPELQEVAHIWAEHGENTEILFGPDMWLGAFVERETGIKDDPERRARFHIWDGECHVHAGIRPDDIRDVREQHPGAEFLIHPECGCSTQAMEYVASGDIDDEGVQMLSTGGMLDYIEKHPTGEYIVATENGMLHPLQKAAPQATLIEANRMAFCKYMKMITLPKVRDSLRDFKYEVKVPAKIAERAKLPIERMVAIG